MLALLFSWSRTHFRAIGFALFVTLAFGAGRWSKSDTSPFALSVSYPAGHVTTIKVPVPVLTPSVVKEYVKVEDRAAVNQLLAENRQLKVQIEQLSITTAAGTSTSTGTATVTPITPATTVVPVDLAFKDWRLDFRSHDSQVTYTLSQSFSIVNTIGKNNKGVETNLVRLYEVGPGNVRTLIPTVETTTIAADVTANRWYLKPTIQAGLGVTQGLQGATQQTVGVLAVPFFKRGRTHATEDTRYAILTPALSFRDGPPTFGILPVSFNVGTIPKTPLTNLWVSPFISITNGVTFGTKFGATLTATF